MKNTGRYYVDIKRLKLLRNSEKESVVGRKWRDPKVTDCK